MIEEDYVSFETAKLLQKNNADFVTDHFYSPNVNPYERALTMLDGRDYVVLGYYKMPSLSMVTKWLREKYHIYINIQPDFPSDKDYKMCWCCCVRIMYDNCIRTKWYQCNIETYKESCEAAIKYCLENLI